jgi:riboflavin kinase/FMN adenylyltransferase
MLQLEFNQELADLTPEQFVKQILVDGLNAKLVLVGEGFRFGNQGSGNFESLKTLGDQHGFEVIELKRVLVDGEVVSTTLVRELLDLGNVKLVNKMLGRVHEVSGMVEHGLKIGRKIGFPTANIAGMQRATFHSMAFMQAGLFPKATDTRPRTRWGSTRLSRLFQDSWNLTCWMKPSLIYTTRLFHLSL